MRAFYLIFCLLPLSLLAERTDILVLANGDHVTGEIKKMEYGVLTYKTDDLGTLTVKWKDVMKLRSDKLFEITLDDGTLRQGSIDTMTHTGMLEIVHEGMATSMELAKVVGIVQINNTFFSRLDGSVSMGLNYTVK